MAMILDRSGQAQTLGFNLHQVKDLSGTGHVVADSLFTIAIGRSQGFLSTGTRSRSVNISKAKKGLLRIDCGRCVIDCIASIAQILLNDLGNGSTTLWLLLADMGQGDRGKLDLPVIWMKGGLCIQDHREGGHCYCWKMNHSPSEQPRLEMMLRLVLLQMVMMARQQSRRLLHHASWNEGA